MIRSARRLVGAAILLGLASCGSSPVTYYKLSVTPSGAMTGTDCPSSTATETVKGLGSDYEIAVYTEPNGVSYVDLGASPGLNEALGFGTDSDIDLGIDGTQSGNSYSFAGSWTQSTPAQVAMEGNPGTASVTTTVKIGLKFTTSGNGLTGTITEEGSCTSGDDMSCGSSNPIDSAGFESTDSKNFDCIESSTIVGAQESAPDQVSQVGAGEEE